MDALYDVSAPQKRKALSITFAVLVWLVLGGVASGQQGMAQSPDAEAVDRLAVLDDKVYVLPQQVQDREGTEARMQVIPLHESKPPYPALRQRISIHLQDATVEEALDQIMRRSTIRLAYLRETVDIEKRVTLHRDAATVWEVLRVVLQDTGLHLTHLSGQQFVLSHVPETEHRVEVFALQQPTPIESAPLELLRLNAQKRQEAVTGRVTDASSGEALPGVNVVVKGTTVGTATDSRGNYQLTAPSLQDTLVFSFIGYQTEEVPIDGRTVINVSLRSQALTGEEVVVTGYGTQARREVTGSISSVEAEAVNQISEASLENALQGRVAGLQMTQAGGSPANRSRILIRGINSISAGTEPLVVIDGMPVSGSHQSAGGMDQAINPLALVNPSDVESIEVLKDAAATAIYGSRGSNGVILITTKDGRQGGGLTVNYSTGVSTPVDTYDFVGTAQWLELADRAKANNPSGLDPFDPATDYDFATGEAELTRQELESINVDWFDKILQPGNYHDINLSASGGNDAGTNYYASASYRTDEGYLVGNDLDRLIARANLDLTPLQNLTAGIRTNFSLLHQDEVPVGGGAPCCNDQIANGNWNAAVGDALPWLPVRGENGNFFDPLSGNNLVATLNSDWYTSWGRNIRTLGKVYADYRIPNFEELEIHSEASLDYRVSTSLRSATGDLRPAGTPYGRQQGGQNWDYNYNAYATYQNTFLGSHDVGVTTGAEAFSQNFMSEFIEALNRTATDEMIGSPSGDDIQRLQFARGEEIRFIGYFARLNYNYEGRYIAQFSFRRDGSSVFGADRRFGTFPAGSVGWVMSDEPFLSDVDVLSFLKLRGSYGLTGNSNIPGGATDDQFPGWKRYGRVSTGYYLNQIGSQEVGWETTKSTDVGFEYGLFDGRVTGSLAYYRQDVEEMLLASPIAESNGTGSEQIWANIGDLRNDGLEFQVRSINIGRSDFTWQTDFNLTLNRNEVLSLTPIIADNNSGLRQGVTNTRIGQQIGLYFMPKSAGVNPDTGYEMIYAADNDPFLVNEDGEFVDESGNVVNKANRIANPDYLQPTGETLPATQSNMANNRALLEDKSGIPSYFGGLTNSLSYEGFNLSFTLNFQGGNYLYDNVMERATRVLGTRNLSTELVGNFWTENNRDAKYPKPSWRNQYEVDGEIETFGEESSMYLYRGDYVRLRRVRIGYDLPSSVLRTINARGMEVYVTGSNLWTYAPDFPGLDPEVTSFGNPQARNLSPGIIGSGFRPPARQFSVGINMSF